MLAPRDGVDGVWLAWGRATGAQSGMHRDRTSPPLPLHRTMVDHGDRWDTRTGLRCRIRRTLRASVLIDKDDIPAGQVLWLFVPPDYLTTGQRQYDFGIIVTPKQLAGSGAGQAGCFDGKCSFGFATYANTTMSGYNLIAGHVHHYWADNPRLDLHHHHGPVGPGGVAAPARADPRAVKKSQVSSLTVGRCSPTHAISIRPSLATS